MFTQILDPTGNLFLTWLVALIPVVLLLVLLAGLRMSAWLAVLIGSIVTFLLGLWVWQMPFGDGSTPIFTAPRRVCGMSTGSRFGE
jgi:lactate permease